jgi:CHASE2 domain-containing sensor protein
LGTTAHSINDGFLTPYSAGYSPIKSIPGLFIQAQMVSQILSAVQDNRPLLQALPKWGEFILILGSAVIGEIILTVYVARQQNKILFYLIIGGVSFLFIGGIGYFYLIKGVWIPIVPLGLALVLMGVKQSILP